MSTLELNVNLKPSRQFIALMLLLILGSLIIAWSLPWPILARLLLSLSVITYGAHIIWHYGLLKSRHAISQLMIHSSGCYLKDKKKIWVAQLSGNSTLTTVLCVLRFSIPQKRFQHSCVIFKDSMGQEQYRRLLVALQSVKLHGVMP